MRVIIAAGGTGGHIYPALSLANELTNQGYIVKFISSNNQVAHEILDETNLDVTFMDLKGFSRQKSFKAIIDNFKTLYKLSKVMVKTNKIIKEFKPDCCIGFGSYITYPVIKLAKKKGIKTIIHEQNSYPGLVNRKLANQVDYVAYTYKASLEYFNQVDKDKLIYTSNPRISGLKPHPKGEGILILGGSLGADFLNNLAFELADLTDEKITLVSGSRNKLTSNKANLEIIEFIPNMLEVIANARVVITRAGATTLLECCALGKNTIAIPSPNVVCDHQTKNAMELSQMGLIRYISENNANSEAVYKLVEEEVNLAKFNNIDANNAIIKLIND